MAVAQTDDNGRKTIICTSLTDGTTIVPIKATVNHVIKTTMTTGSDEGNNAPIDDNNVSVWTALSSAGDGTFVQVYADASTGELLINPI